MLVNNDRPDIDSVETQEWLDALASVMAYEGPQRAEFILKKLLENAQALNLKLGITPTTPYRNTISPETETTMPDDNGMAERIAQLIRWNAVAMVLRAGKKAPELGGHIATYASAAILYEVGFNHFFKADQGQGGDLLYIQGHSSPGIYARAFLEGRLSTEQLDHFRQEIDANGLSSYPHPWLMRDFWQFATVSMGLGPIQAIYQARFLNYLHHRGLTTTAGRKVWAFLGDGEMDEPESLGALSIAARERLDNLIFVVNCNLQRLDGPVRGNSKIIQELESIFNGAGWNVIKVVWGSGWDALFVKDKHGFLQKRMEECVDGEYQAYKARGAAYVREHFFGKYPELLAMVADMSDDEIWDLNRGGLDPQKMYAAYSAAVNHTGQPTVILAKTIKGYGMGAAGQAMNITHQKKKMTVEELRVFRDKFNIPVGDHEIDAIPFYRPPEDSPEMQYLQKQRKNLGGYLPARRYESESLPTPELSAFKSVTHGLGDRELSTTMIFVRTLNILLRDKVLGKRIVPIIPDECRTFGMEGMFRQYGIYSPNGQLYTPEDSEQLMFYKEAQDGQVLQEGLNEAGAFCSWLAAATSYSSNNYPMIPFFVYYSMFGFQRIGDLAYAAGDMNARGFLLGGTAGRTTLAGEGLQHQDGHSHILASTIPNCISYDPTYAYELAVIIQDGLRRMVQKQENVYYYITIMNENYQHPDMPKGVEEAILKGMYLLQKAEGDKKALATVQLLGSGSILREVIKAAQWLKRDFNVESDIWSVTSFNELRRDAHAVERARLLQQATADSYVQQCFKGRQGPFIAATDYMRMYAEQIRPEVPGRYVTLGTDGFGRSDTRAKLRHFFEVDAKYILLASLQALYADDLLAKESINDAIQKYNIDINKPNPLTI